MVPFRDDDYFRAIAGWLGCRFADEAALRKIVAEGAGGTLSADGRILNRRAGDTSLIAMAPLADWLPQLAAGLAEAPGGRDGLIITTPQALAVALDRGGAVVQTGRLDPLHAAPAGEVADRVVTAAQARLTKAALAAMIIAGVVGPYTTLTASSLVMAVVLAAYALSRLLALIGPPQEGPPSRPLRTSELPVYTVLIPLYREDEGVAELVRAIRRLDYPPDRLDVQFLVEAHDVATRKALEREAAHLPCRIVVVPEGHPRTKPRALNVGLRQARGTLCTIFDAEDRPAPEQLRLAAETFAANPPDLAALQARLVIDHREHNWLTRMFAVEYACQFDRILPLVASRGGLFLLGGTSNHFRTDALIKVGGWDPFNVTEDADLAVRLRRRGFRLGVIASDTFEEAPLEMGAWLKQRSRWFKGYIQTALVHARDPVTTLRELGARDTALLHLFIVGAVTAALAHTLFIAMCGLALVGVFPLFGGQSAGLMAGQVALAFASYGVNYALAFVVLRARKRPGVTPACLIWLPFYWVLLGIAVGIAVYDLIRRPHHWRKTTHHKARRRSRIVDAGL